MDGWTVSSEWKTSNGLLLSDGSNGTDHSATDGTDSATPPYQPQTANYAVEARMQILHSADPCYLGFRGRFQPDASGSWYDGYAVEYDSYFGDDLIATFSPNNYFTVLKSAIYNPGLGWHTYRAEFKNNQITFKIDGNVVLQVLENSYLPKFCPN